MSILDQSVTALFFGSQRKLQSSVASIAVNVVIQEETNDILEITQQPVQQGASINDHVFKKPVEFSMRATWSANFLNTLGTQGINSITNPNLQLTKIYQQLQALQSSFLPFSIYTPKRLYTNMLFSALTMVTDKTTENCLMVFMRFRQIIFVPVTTTIAPPAQQTNAASTQATQPGGNNSAELNMAIGLGVTVPPGGL